MLEITFDTFPTISTERLMLRQLQETDAEAFFELRSDVEVMRYIDRPLAKSVEEVGELIKRIHGLYAGNEAILWVISLPGDQKMIGNITFWNIDKENHRAEIGYLLNPQQHQKGIMQEALVAVLDYGFSNIGVHSVVANVNPANEASKKLLVKNNFVQEGYFKEDYFFDGQFLDSAVYSLLTPLK